VSSYIIDFIDPFIAHTSDVNTIHDDVNNINTILLCFKLLYYPLWLSFLRDST